MDVAGSAVDALGAGPGRVREPSRAGDDQGRCLDESLPGKWCLATPPRGLMPRCGAKTLAIWLAGREWASVPTSAGALTGEPYRDPIASAG